MTDESPFAECHQEVDISAFVSTAIEGEAELWPLGNYDLMMMNENLYTRQQLIDGYTESLSILPLCVLLWRHNVLCSFIKSESFVFTQSLKDFAETVIFILDFSDLCFTCG